MKAMWSRIRLAIHVAVLALSGDTTFFRRWEARHINGADRFLRDQADARELARYREVTELQTGDIQEAIKQLGALRLRVKKQAREIRNMQEVAEYRNKQLAALHVVWCSGGCEGGVGCKEEVTREVVIEGVRNIKRLVQWWNSYMHRQGPNVYEAQRVDVNEVVVTCSYDIPTCSDILY
jgi:hypothetical protein